MAANINVENGVASFFSVKEKAWHGLGTILDKCPTSEEAMAYAGLNYDVELAPLYAKFQEVTVPDAKSLTKVLKLETNTTQYYNTKEVGGKYATFRTDNNAVFGVVGSKYHIVQNREAFSFFDAIVGENQAIYETAGALGNGEIVFITAKLPDYIRVGNDDIEKYLLFTMAHDGSVAIKAMFTPIRVVCNNTLTAAIKGAKDKISLRHTKNVKDKLEEAHKILGITNMLSNELSDIYNIMAKKRIQENEFEAYIRKSLGLDISLTIDEIPTKSKNVIESIKEYNEIGAGQQLEVCKGTVYGAYQAITGYLQNVRTYKDEENKFSNIFDGTAKDINDKALSAGLQLIR